MKSALISEPFLTLFELTAPFLIFCAVTAPLLILFVVTALFLSFLVPTLLFGMFIWAYAPLPSASSSAMKATTMDGDGRRLRMRRIESNLRSDGL
jgi:ABC-type transport system involved in multi-copper enzyme maturation permease subunit